MEKVLLFCKWFSITFLMAFGLAFIVYLAKYLIVDSFSFYLAVSYSAGIGIGTGIPNGIYAAYMLEEVND